MSVTGYMFGHEVYYVPEDETWHWLDNGLETEENPRPCPQCKNLPTEDGHDPCLGSIPGVVSACCGHGVQDGYIMWEFGDYPRDALGAYVRKRVVPMFRRALPHLPIGDDIDDDYTVPDERIETKPKAVYRAKIRIGGVRRGKPRLPIGDDIKGTNQELSDEQIAVFKCYPATTISEVWVKGQDGKDDLVAAYHPKIDCITGLGNTHEEAIAQLLKERYRQYLWGEEHGVVGAGLWK